MKTTRVAAALAGVAACLALAGRAAAENPRLSELDRKFVQAAASGGAFEVKASDMAKERGGGEAVKRFAQHMIDDHGKANKEFMDLLKKDGIAMPTEMGEKERVNIDRLSKLEGADFDREYLKQQLAAHKGAVALFEEQAKDGKNADLKAFAEKTLPTLREHLKEVTKLAGGDRPEK
jgi:putative membrane protein